MSIAEKITWLLSKLGLTNRRNQQHSSDVQKRSGLKCNHSGHSHCLLQDLNIRQSRDNCQPHRTKETPEKTTGAQVRFLANGNRDINSCRKGFCMLFWKTWRSAWVYRNPRRLDDSSPKDFQLKFKEAIQRQQYLSSCFQTMICLVQARGVAIFLTS